MKRLFLLTLIALIFIVTLFTAFDNADIDDKQVKTKYDELVAKFLQEQDKTCRQSALEEAKLTWTTTINSGEEEDINEESRLSKPHADQN